MIEKHSLVVNILFGVGLLLVLLLGYQYWTDRADSRPIFSFEGVTRPQVYKESPQRGSGDVILFEYADFSCPGCATQQKTIQEIMQTYGFRVTHVWKDFPFRSPISLDAAKAGRCAHEQGKFWQYHDYIFAHQDVLDSRVLLEAAEQVDLDTTIFSVCVNDRDTDYVVQRDFAEGQYLGVSGTPTLVIGDTALVGVVTYQELEQAIIQALGSTQ